MGLFNSKARTERKAFRSIVNKRSTQAARSAFADEAVKVAAEKAKAQARRKSIGEIVLDRLRTNVESRASGRRVVKRRATPKARVVRKKVTKKRSAPKRKVTKRRASPRVRVVRRKAVKRITTQSPTPAPTQTSPTTLNEAMYGGY